MASPVVAEPYSGCRLSVVLAPHRSRRCHEASVSACLQSQGSHPPFSCTLADGGVRHFHKTCLPSRLLYHAVPHARYLAHIPGLSQYLSSINEPQYLHGLDERLKADCAEVARFLDGTGESGVNVSERELSLFVDQTTASHFSCLICVDKVVHLPVSTGCHVFCRHCWDGWVLSSTNPYNRERVSCPVCRASVELSQVAPCEKVIQRVIASLKVRCVQSIKGCFFVTEFGIDGEKARAHARGSCALDEVRCSQCDWRGRRGALGSHRCQPPQPCPHPGCNHSGPREWLAQHIKHCPREPIQCSTCQHKYPRCEPGEHGSGNCTYRCKHCHSWIAKVNRTAHQTNERYRLCNAFQPCRNGCGAPVLRGVQNKHDDTCEEATVRCNDCRANMKRKNFPRHCEKVHQDRYSPPPPQYMQSSDDDYY